MPMSINGSFAVLASDFEQLTVQLGDSAANAILEEAAQPLLEQMRANAPVKAGRLRAAINTGHASARKASITVGVHRKDWSGEDYYPAYVEYGHGGKHPAPPHPYIRPAVDAAGDAALERLADLVAKALGK